MTTQLVFIDKATAALDIWQGLQSVLSEQPDTDFVLLQAIEPGYDDPESTASTSMRSRFFLISQDLPVAETIVGNEVPRKAIIDEVRRAAYDYAGVLLALRSGTQPADIDLSKQLERQLSLPVAPLRRSGALKNVSGRD